MVTANRASALYALAAESDYLDMAENAVSEFQSMLNLFEGTDYEQYQATTRQQLELAKTLVQRVQV